MNGFGVSFSRFASKYRLSSKDAGRAYSLRVNTPDKVSNELLDLEDAEAAPRGTSPDKFRGAAFV